MTNQQKCAFFASDNSIISANGATVTGYENVAVAYNGSTIELQNAVVTSPEAIKLIASVKSLVAKSDELIEEHRIEVLRLLDSIQTQPKGNALQICERILTISSSAITIYPIIETCVQKIISCL